MVPLIPYAMNYPGMSMSFPYNYPVARTMPCRPTHLHMPILGSSKKRPILASAQNSRNSGSSSTNAMKQDSESNLSNECSQIGENKSHETIQSKQDSPRSSDDDSSKGTPRSFLKAQSQKSEMKGFPWGSRTEVTSTSKAYTLVQAPHSHHVLAPAPNCFIHVPLMYQKPGISLASAYHQGNQKSTYINNVDTSILKGGDTTDGPMTFGSNPWFEGIAKQIEREPKQDATVLKTQIIKKVEELFEMANRKSSTTDIPESDTDSEGHVDETLDPLGNVQLIETVMKCCIEVETYWTESARDCNARALILECCKSIRRLMSNDLRQNAEANIVSSLQELTLSLTLLFLISSLS